MCNPEFWVEGHSSGRNHPGCYINHRGAAFILKSRFVPKSGLAGSNMGERRGAHLGRA